MGKADKPNFQGTVFTHDPTDTDNNDVAATYKRWKDVWPGVRPLGTNGNATGRDQLKPLIDLLGDPFDPVRFKSNLTEVDLRPFKFKIPNRAVTVHKGIAHRVQWVLQEVATWGGYEIRYCGGYDMRYRRNKTTKRDILNNHLRYRDAADWCRRTYGRADDWTEYCLLYDLHNRPDEVIWRMISNHAFGTAIDLNPKENDLDSNRWDMPPKIVELFRQAGFGWGGLYESSKDAMHFEYALPYLSLRAPAPQFPLCAPRLEEPAMRQYFRNETGKSGGFYPIGTNYNLHMGAHFDAEPAAVTPPAAPPVPTADPVPSPAGDSAETDNPPAPTAAPAPVTDATLVRALGPGYIVAARMAHPLEGCADATDFVGRSVCFVLVRHALRALPEKNPPTDTKEAPFFSLYMHLEPVELGSPWVARVPWLAQMLRWRFGDAVCLDPSQPTLGKAFPLGAASDSIVGVVRSVNRNQKTVTSHWNYLLRAYEAFGFPDRAERIQKNLAEMQREGYTYRAEKKK